ncbi:DUF2515 family protein [Paenibacillus sp. GYB003]|uniref:DUF2515 family protein n=1 Tax=Paenibacillus sp. GYB003 TaxID=2994392 RepID=UPI002F96C700
MSRTEERRRFRGLWQRLQTMPLNIVSYITGKWAGWWQSEQLSQHAVALTVSKEEVKRLKERTARYAGAGSNNPRLTPEERELAESIREETKRLNANNVTRTAAYLRVYERSPELHWAFLAHMVSRNGGWNMTDLKGELVSRLMSASRARSFFEFLERSNSFIFHDAYPQLRLYELSKERKRAMFHLLPFLGVSAFMRPIWEQFWLERQPALLTVGLIVNEQHYIERRIVRSERYKRAVLDTPAFAAQSLLQLNAVVFPYYRKEGPERPDAGGQEDECRLAGLVIEQFERLRERIEFGKKLYALLFGVPAVGAGVRAFASSRPHSGSRADYWPHLFAPIRKDPPSAAQAGYAEKLDGGKLLPGAAPLYSPKLELAWPNVPFERPEPFDWYVEGTNPFRYFATMRPPSSFEMTNEYRFILNKLELAVMAGQMLFE